VVFQKRMRGILARRLRKNETLKVHITREILDTEETYVGQLRHLVLDYMSELGKRQGRDPIISQELWTDLFGPVPGVLEYNSELLKQIRVRVKNWHYEQKIGDVFVAASSKLANYTTYVNNYNRGNILSCPRIISYFNGLPFLFFVFVFVFTLLQPSRPSTKPRRTRRLSSSVRRRARSQKCASPSGTC